MKRKIYERLKKWKDEKNGRTAILVEGARRVGKSYIVEEFVKNEYDAHIIIDFSHTSSKIVNLFKDDTSDIPLLLQKLSDLTRTTFIPRRTAIVFDEVQKCPQARECIKFLVADGRYDYIETGSLISIHDNIKDIIIPSEEEKIQMYPMDFEEFCWALGDETTVPRIRDHFSSRQPLGNDLHEVYLNLFREYMIVGGMPKAVETYADTKDFSKVEEEKRLIISLYREDIGRLSKRYKRRTTAIFDAIPSELSKHNKEFSITSIDRNGKMGNYEEPIYWLYDSMVVNICYNSVEPSRALGMNLDSSSRKIYLGDTGLLVSMAIGNNEDYGHDIYVSLLQDRMHINEGMFMENIVAQMLRSNGHDLYFHLFYKRREDGTLSKNRYEIDFLIPDGRKVALIEVKSGNSTMHASLDNAREKYSKNIGQTYVIHAKDLRKDGNVLYIPLYMTICL